jgi:predicted DNA-binding protein YlxM (UPF0122 family)
VFAKTVRQGLLLDFYGPLLTDQQREILAGYLNDDLSLAELAEQRGVSRAAVHDMVRRGLRALERYEERLGLVERYERERVGLRRLLGLIEQALAGKTGERGVLEEVRGFLEQALNEGEGSGGV